MVVFIGIVKKNVKRMEGCQLLKEGTLECLHWRKNGLKKGTFECFALESDFEVILGRSIP